MKVLADDLSRSKTSTPKKDVTMKNVSESNEPEKANKKTEVNDGRAQFPKITRKEFETMDTRKIASAVAVKGLVKEIPRKDGTHLYDLDDYQITECSLMFQDYCKKCGDPVEKHGHDPEECPSLKARREIGCDKFCEIYYCKRRNKHTTETCPSLHHRCLICLEMGHFPTDCGKTGNPLERRAYFDKMKDQGVFTKIKNHELSIFKLN